VKRGSESGSRGSCKVCQRHGKWLAKLLRLPAKRPSQRPRTKRRDEKLPAALERLLGYHFLRPDLLVLAMTHRAPLKTPANIRTARISRDAVLDLTIADVDPNFPMAKEACSQNNALSPRRVAAASNRRSPSSCCSCPVRSRVCFESSPPCIGKLAHQQVGDREIEHRIAENSSRSYVGWCFQRRSDGSSRERADRGARMITQQPLHRAPGVFSSRRLVRGADWAASRAASVISPTIPCRDKPCKNLDSRF